MSEARELNHAYVGTEHLLLGLLREKVGIAAEVLTDAGATLELVRAETLRLLGADEPRPPSRKQPSHRDSPSVAYEFSPELGRSLQLALEEAVRLGSDQVDAVHIALAILGMRDGAAVAVLTALGVDSIAQRGNLEAKLSNRGAKEVGSLDLPYTNQAENVLGLAVAEARELHHPEVGSEHLLLGLLREGVFEVPNAPLSDVRMKVVELSVKRVTRPASRDSKFKRVVRSSTIRLVGGIVFVLSGVEALWYAPGILRKALGLLGVCGGLLMIAFWGSFDRKRGSGSG